VAPIHVTEVLLGIRDLAGTTLRTDRPERIPALSVGSAMEAVREPTHFEDSPALAASTAAEAASMVVAEASTAEAATEAGAIDSPHEEIKK